MPITASTRRHWLAAVLFSTSMPVAFAANTTKPDSMDPAAPKVKLHTNLGDVIIRLDAVKAPITTANFLTYVREGHYDGTIFHRIIPGFMAQGGGLTQDFRPKSTHAPIRNEADNGLKNKRGTVAMARTSDPDSATGQFFINYVDNDFLNHKNRTPQGWGYAVFGEVVEGMEIVDAMAKIPTGPGGPLPEDVPQQPIVIEKASVLAP
jgi:peptidyl-prolyl cis-trans isomerase B (cyclophilin B)